MAARCISISSRTGSGAHASVHGRFDCRWNSPCGCGDARSHPKVSGRGFDQLRAAGVLVEVGELEAEARWLNEAFARYIRHGVSLVTLKSAMTMDGKIAPPPGAGLSHKPGTPAGGWITGEAARAHVQQQRHQSDAILVGVGTVLADDPLLTDRNGRPRRRPLLRVILDSRLRLPLESRLVRSAANDVLVFCLFGNDGKKRELEARGIRVEELPAAADGRPDIHAVIRRLGELQITSLTIEGGSTVNGVALASGVVDKVFLYYAPTILGEGSVPFAADASLAEGVPALRLTKRSFIALATTLR